MRILHAQTQQLIDLPAGEKYAILSHTWEGDEVTFQDMQDPAKARRKEGFNKIEGLCRRAWEDEYSYCWADTCCINKESSAELSEAINSMYKWYQSADVCYALLTDVETNSTSNGPLDKQLMRSRWFTRGWTLQELLAPKTLVFFDRNWNMLGTKASMTDLLARLSRIDGAVLRGEASLSQRSIAQRMSWAAGRATTRVEDIAYCLLGIFDVNMPMIYGEGEKAFIRLQLQIIEQSDDHSIFAWPIAGTGKQGMLADSPAAFRHSGGIISVPSRKGRPPYRMTNRGLSLELPAVPFAADTYLAELDCVDVSDASSYGGRARDVALGIFLRRLEEDDQYARVEHNGETFRIVPRQAQRAKVKVSIRQHANEISERYQQAPLNGFRVDGNLSPANPKDIGYRPDMFIWDKHEQSISTNPCEGFGDVGYLAVDLGKVRFMKLGFDVEFNPVCFLASTSGRHKKEVGYFNTKHNKYALTEGLRPTEEGNIQRLGIVGRHSSDMVGWSDLRNGKAAELEYHDGLWAVKGDRLQGIDVLLENSGSKFSQKEVRLIIIRDKSHEPKDWRVRLELV